MIKNKIASIMVTSTLMSACMSGCATNVSEKYAYADDWNIPNDIQEVSAVRELYAYSEETEHDISPLKEVVRESLKHYDFLDWEKFNRLSSVREVNITEDDLSSLSQEEIATISSYAAFYDDETDSIIICPAFFEFEDDGQRFYAIIHEIIHSLVSNNRHKADHLDEGVVDTLALKVVDDANIDCRPGYQIAILATEWLIAIFGEDEYYKAVHDGVAEQMIDNATRDGLGKKLNYAMILAHSKKFPSEELNVIYDILAHLANNTGKTAPAKDLLQKDVLLFSYAGIDIDTKYFEKLLK